MTKKQHSGPDSVRLNCSCSGYLLHLRAFTGHVALIMWRHECAHQVQQMWAIASKQAPLLRQTAIGLVAKWKCGPLPQTWQAQKWQRERGKWGSLTASSTSWWTRYTGSLEKLQEWNLTESERNLGWHFSVGKDCKSWWLDVKRRKEK